MHMCIYTYMYKVLTVIIQSWEYKHAPQKKLFRFGVCVCMWGGGMHVCAFVYVFFVFFNVGSGTQTEVPQLVKQALY